MKKIALLLAFSAIALSTVPASAWVARGGGGWRNGGWVAHGGWGYGHGCCWGGGYRPGWGGVAAGVAAGAAVGAVTAAAIGSTIATLPPDCVVGPNGYYGCGGAYYSPVYGPGGVVYQAVPAP